MTSRRSAGRYDRPRYAGRSLVLELLQRLVRRAFVGLVLAIVLLALVFWIWPPKLLRIGAGYTAKIVCSSVFLQGRDPDDVLALDVQAPGTALLRFMRVSVDQAEGVVHASFLGFIARSTAVSQAGVGCALLPDGKLAGIEHPLERSPPARPATSTELWPEGSRIELNPRLAQVVNDRSIAGEGMRAVVVVHQGRIVAEGYGPHFGLSTPQLGWSMTKSVTAALVGILVKDRLLRLDQGAGFAAGDGRETIKIADLLSMTSGLTFDEGSGAVSDLTQMLFLQGDMAAFARAQPLAHPAGTFWSYSSGNAVILARIFQDTAGPDALKLVHERLFDPLGMTSAVMETDAHGTLVGSSYMYATPRDWARFGLFLLRQGQWNGQEILPPGFVSMMASPVEASQGRYGKGLVWLWGSEPDAPGENPDAAYGLPKDTFWMEGHDGQSIAVIPSKELVVVRMGLTPRHLGYQPQPLVRAVLAALPPT